MTGCPTCGGYGMKHDPIAHGVEPPGSNELSAALYEVEAAGLRSVAAFGDFIAAVREEEVMGCPHTEHRCDRATGRVIGYDPRVNEWGPCKAKESK